MWGSENIAQVMWPHSRPCLLTLREEHTQYAPNKNLGWLQSFLEVLKKINIFKLAQIEHCYLLFSPQPSRYTDYIIPAHNFSEGTEKNNVNII